METTVRSAPFFRTSGGRDVTLYTLQSGPFSASVCDWGATLVSVWVPAAGGNAVDVLCGHGEPAAYERNPGHFGSTVGRFANRIANARFSLDGVEYALDRNEKDHHLHGGSSGFSARFWSAAHGTAGDDAFVELCLDSPEGDCGYPGNVSVKVRFTLSSQGNLAMDYSGHTDRPTPMSLTSHPYFNLHGTGNALGHVVRLRAQTVLPVAPDRIPSGPPVPIAGSPLDVSGETVVRELVARTGGVDSCYPLSDPGSMDSPAAILRDPESGRSLSLYTDMPAVQLYTGNSMGGRSGKGGIIYENWGAVCIEPEYYPDSPNQPGFPDCVLRPGSEYRHRIRFAFRP